MRKLLLGWALEGDIWMTLKSEGTASHLLHFPNPDPPKLLPSKIQKMMERKRESLSRRVWGERMRAIPDLLSPLSLPKEKKRKILSSKARKFQLIIKRERRRTQSYSHPILITKSKNGIHNAKITLNVRKSTLFTSKVHLTTLRLRSPITQVSVYKWQRGGKLILSSLGKINI